MTVIVKEAMWLHGLVENLRVKQDHIVIYYDNGSALNLFKNKIHHSLVRHIDV